MADSVSIRERTYLPGHGFSASGAPKQGKTRISAVVSGTAAAGGFSLTPQELGLTAVDVVVASLRAVAGASPSGASGATFDSVAQKLITFNSGAELTAGVVSVGVIATGDSADDVESLA